MNNKKIDNLIDSIDRECDIVLEQLRLEYIDSLQAIEILQDLSNKLED